MGKILVTTFSHFVYFTKFSSHGNSKFSRSHLRTSLRQNALCSFVQLPLSLQVLRSSMIELINQDYADFVQLSTVLVGVDQGILAIREPIEGFSKEVAAARAELASCLDRWVDKVDIQSLIVI